MQLPPVRTSARISAPCSTRPASPVGAGHPPSRRARFCWRPSRAAAATSSSPNSSRSAAASSRRVPGAPRSRPGAAAPAADRLLDPRHPGRAAQAGPDRGDPRPARPVSTTSSSSTATRTSCRSTPPGPSTTRVRPLLRYTGYVDEGERGRAGGRSARGIVVSGGSSAAALPLYRAAIAAARPIPDQPWRVLVGNGRRGGRLRATSARGARARRRRARAAGLSRPPRRRGRLGQPGGLQHRRRPPPRPARRRSWCRSRPGARRSSGCAPRPRGARPGDRPVRRAELLGRAPRRDAVRAAARSATPPAIDGRPRAARSAASRSSRTPRRTALPPCMRDATGRRLRWRRRGGPADGCGAAFWWRDDDAVRGQPGARAAARARAASPLPARARGDPAPVEPVARRRARREPRGRALVHGLATRTTRRAGEKKAEFGPHRPLATLAQRGRAALPRHRRASAPRSFRSSCRPGTGSRPTSCRSCRRSAIAGLSDLRDRSAPRPVAGLRRGQHAYRPDRLARRPRVSRDCRQS